MSTPFVAAVDAELAELTEAIRTLCIAQAALTPRIFVLRSQKTTLETYRRTLTLLEPGQEGQPS